MILKKTHPFRKNLFTTALTTFSLAVLSTNLFAGDIELYHEYNAVALGDGGAGGAALASDASTLVLNPAGMVRIPNKQLVVSAVGVFASVKFSGTNTWTNPLLSPVSFSQTGVARGDANAFIPGMYFVMPLTKYWFAGISVSAPFGLETSYTNSSILRYNSTDSWLKVVDISPNIAAKINEQLSFGFGLDFDKANLIFRAKAGFPNFPGLSPTALDATSKNTADGWGYGWHAGALYQLSESTRFGLGYHSKIILPLNGHSSLSGGLVQTLLLNNVGFRSDTLRTRFVLPASTILSGHHDLNQKWSIDGTIRYTAWSDTNRNVTLYNVAGLGSLITLSLPHNYRDTWLFGVGGSYKATEKWLLRAGVSYDQSPIKSSERNVVIPDSDRIALAIGTHVQPWKTVGFDVGYTHLFFKDATVNIPTVVSSQTSVANGKFTNHGDIFGVQVTWDIV